MSLKQGAHMGPYVIVDLIGTGGMGEVYRAHDQRLRRDVAIKILPASASDDDEARVRFERELRMVARLSHPNILSLHDVGVQGDITYAVMELLEGATLREHLRSGALPADRALDFAVQISRGLAAAHERGVVHRDLKPENLFITREGLVKILDFGLARRVAPLGAAERTATTALTESGRLLGTPLYMSPEQVRGESVDLRSDVFAMGAVLYEMFTGERAFMGATLGEVMASILIGDSPRLADATANRIVQRCLEKRPERRYPSAGELRDALVELTRSGVRPTVVSRARPRANPKRWWAWAVAIGAVLVVAAGFALLGRGPDPCDRAILEKVRIDGAASDLGLLVDSDVHATPDGSGCYRQYAYGMALRRGTSAVVIVHGYIYGRWLELGTFRGALGYPTSDEQPLGASGDRVSHFEHGDIVWHRGAVSAQEIMKR